MKSSHYYREDGAGEVLVPDTLYAPRIHRLSLSIDHSREFLALEE